MPNLDAIIADPSNAAVPGEPAVLFALAGGLAQRATENNFGRVLTYLARIPEELSGFSVRDAVRMSPDLQHTPEYTAWAVTHPD
jgi:hypothetical protein